MEMQILLNMDADLRIPRLSQFLVSKARECKPF